MGAGAKVWGLPSSVEPPSPEPSGAEYGDTFGFWKPCFSAQGQYEASRSHANLAKLNEQLSPQRHFLSLKNLEIKGRKEPGALPWWEGSWVPVSSSLDG